MTDLTKEELENVSPGLREKLLENDPPEVSLILKVEPEHTDEVTSDLTEMGYKPRAPVNIPNTELAYIPVDVKQEDVPEVSKMQYVEEVKYNAPRAAGQLFVSPPKFEDPFFGKFGISEIEVKGIPLMAVPLYFSQVRRTPLSEEVLAAGAKFGRIANRITSTPLSMLTQFSPLTFTSPKIDKIFPTGKTRNVIGAPVENEVEEIKVSVLDTGAPSTGHLLWRDIQKAVSFTGEAPQDGLGHGSFCQTCAFGKEAPTPYGECKGVAEVSGENMYAGKVLSNAGAGSTESVIRGMNWAVNQGVDVVSMSLGGPSQGRIKDDPEASIIQETSDDIDFIVAAGNSGPDKWTVGSPGNAPAALTVGSYSMLGEVVSKFSSRGPNTKWYKNHQDAWEADLDKYGEDLIKPDVLAPGGGPGTGKNKRDDIYSAGQGWTDPMADFIWNTLTAMRGTSMATPHVAGALALMKEKDIVGSAEEVKETMKNQDLIPEDEKYENYDKSISRGYGLLHFKYFPRR